MGRGWPKGKLRGIRRKNCKDCARRLTRYNCTTVVKKGRTYLHTYCRTCNTRRSVEWKTKHPRKNARIRWITGLKRFYGVTPEWYNAKLNEQGGGCAICGRKRQRGRRLGVDHDHTNKRLRGILCGPCNMGLDRMEKIPDWAMKAAAYLEQYKQPCQSP